MKSLIKMAGLAGILALGSVVTVSSLQAAQPAQPVQSLREGQGLVTKLGPDTSAITYWSSEADGWHVVTTVDTVIGQGGPAEQHAVVRFAAVLRPGQSQTVSVPAAVDQASPTLRIERVADHIDVTQVAAPSN
jgi:hypothetical protein